MDKAFAGLALAVLVGSAHAVEVSSGGPDTALEAGCGAFLAAGIGAMIACGLTSFFLAGRVTERTHIALAMLVVLIGAFCLIILFGLSGHQSPMMDTVVLLGLLGLFKLMAQFEIRRRPGRRVD